MLILRMPHILIFEKFYRQGVGVAVTFMSASDCNYFVIISLKVQVGIIDIPPGSIIINSSIPIDCTETPVIDVNKRTFGRICPRFG